MNSSVKTLVIQSGARHGYAIPLAFQRFGALSGLYTDFASNVGLGRAARPFANESSPFGKKLARRELPASLIPLTKTFALPFLKQQAISRVTGSDPVVAGFSAMEDAMAEAGFGNATHIYTMFGEGGRLVRAAKEAGLGVIGDVYIALSSNRIVAEEARLHPDWATEIPPQVDVETTKALNHTLLEYSDLLVCPSEFVRDDLLLHGVAAGKTVVAPYAVSPKWTSITPNPEPRRVLFAGSADIRKGIHYLAEASQLLKGQCRFRIAGSVSDTVRNHPLASELQFLGHLGPNEMRDEFAQADVFAFPSLVEGSAGVTAEALGAGVPVVTTKASGSIVRDGVDGLIIPERDPESLAQAILSIVEDRDRRAAMGIAARKRALGFDWDGFVSTVLEGLHDLPRT